VTVLRRGKAALLPRALALLIGLTTSVLAWSPPERLSHPPPGWIATEPDLAIGPDGRVHVVWTQWRGPYSPQYLYYTCRSDTWTTPKCISADSFGLVSSAIAVDTAGTVVVVWSDADDGELRFTTTMGDSWAAPDRMFAHSGTIPRLAAVGQGLVDVLFDGYDGIWHSSYTRVADTWATPRLVATGPASLSWEDLAVDCSRRRHAVWMDYDTYGLGYAYGDGTNWSEPSPLPDPAPGAQSCDPRIDTDGNGRPHVVWEERIGGPSIICHSARVGDTWSVPFQVNQDGDCYSPVVRSDGLGNVHVIWREIQTGWSGLMHRFVRPGGEWSAAETVSSLSGWPELARSGEGLHLYVVWCTGIPERQTYFSEQVLSGAVAEASPATRPRSSGLVIAARRSGLELTFTLERAAPVTVFVADAAGRVLSETAVGFLQAGQQRIRVPTNGTDARGVLLVTVRAGEYRETGKFVLAR